MKLTTKLTKPIAFLDVESTGLDTAKDRIITLAVVRIGPGRDGAYGPLDVDANSEDHLWQFNPGVEMSPENMAIHGITNEMVKDWPRFETQARQIHGVLSGCDLGGFNLSNFDISIIWEELYRCGIEWELDGVNIVDVGVIFKKKEPRDLKSAVKFYLNREHENAHGAMEDTLATLEVFIEQTWGLPRYGDLAAMDVPALSDFCAVDERDGSRRLDLAGIIRQRKDGVPVFGTKRNKDVPIAHDISYANWILRSDFPTQTRKVLAKIVDDIRRQHENRGQEDLF